MSRPLGRGRPAGPAHVGWLSLRQEVLAAQVRPRRGATGGGAGAGEAGAHDGRTTSALPETTAGGGADSAAPGAEGADWDVASAVRAAKAGDSEAFGELYDHYVDTVYRYVYYRVSQSAVAEDVTSETFVRALRRIDSFEWQGRDLAAWLLTIARNLLADHYKSSRYRQEVVTDDVTELGGTRTTSGPEDEVLDRMTNDTLLRAVRELKDDQRECIVLRFLQGLSVSETAEVMGRKEGAIKALQYRAVRTLARRLPKDVLV